MWITNIDTSVDLQSIDPRFLIRVDFEYYQNQEAPIGFNGFLRSLDGKKLGSIDCEQDNFNGHNAISIPLADTYRNKEIDRNERSRHLRNFSVSLSKQSIDYIESQRLQRQTKNVLVNLELEITTLRFDPSEKREIRINREYGNRQIEIEQSKWLKDYSSSFGIGEFLIIEFSKQRITLNETKSNWTDKLERAKKRLHEMESQLSEGKWEKVIETSRKIWDVFKLYKENPQLKND
jgi:hypothetical protein